MIELRFGADDLLRVRFATSQAQEAVAAVRALADPAAHALHLPWMERVRPLLRDVDLQPLRELLGEPYTPDFLTPSPSTPLGELRDELDAIRATPREQVFRELAWTFGRQPLPPTARALLDETEATLGRLADLLARFWEIALARDWPRVRALLDGDILHRTRRLGEDGIAGLLAGIHPLVQVRGDVIRIAKAHDERSDLAGRGLVLVPSAFSWPEVLVTIDAPHRPTLIYPPRGIALLWDASGPAVPDALAGVLGRARAAILSELDAPRSTTELARCLAASAGGTSTHLGVLRAAGLVRAHRHGRVVLYARTGAGDVLVSAAGS